VDGEIKDVQRSVAEIAREISTKAQELDQYACRVNRYQSDTDLQITTEQNARLCGGYLVLRSELIALIRNLPLTMGTAK